jgi:hypothetical protein
MIVGRMTPLTVALLMVITTTEAATLAPLRVSFSDLISHPEKVQRKTRFTARLRRHLLRTLR